MIERADPPTDERGSGEPTAVIVTRELVKFYEDASILGGIDLTVATGEVVVLVGQSGSGKTTLLRCLSLAEPITSGELIFNEQVVCRRFAGEESIQLSLKDIRAARLDVGIVFQEYNLFPHMTALDNVALAPIHVRKLERDRAHHEAAALLEKVGLGSRASHRPSQLSGGQQQRVAIARALAMEPRLLLFDEVTSALDPQMTGEVLAVMRDLAREGTTMVVVTHEMGFARHVGSRIVFMADGLIVEEGTPAAVLDNPSDPRTRAFVDAVLDSH